MKAGRNGSVQPKMRKARTMREIEVVVTSEQGLHLRVADAIAEAVRAHRSCVHLSCAGCPQADGCSVMQLLTLGAGRGTTVRVKVDGPDEQVTLHAVKELLTDGAGI